MIKKIIPDFFHRKTWQILYSPSSSDADIEVMWNLAELYDEMEEENENIED